MSNFNPETWLRPSLRLSDYDYSQPGSYFLTIATYRRLSLFGEIIDGGMFPSRYGQVVRDCWEQIPAHFSHVQPDVFVVMPNHVHSVLTLAPSRARTEQANQDRHSAGQPASGSLPAIVRSFKSASTRAIHQLRDNSATPIWQSNYYEHVVRSETELNMIREYILANPATWDSDHENSRNHP